MTPEQKNALKGKQVHHRPSVITLPGKSAICSRCGRVCRKRAAHWVHTAVMAEQNAKE